MKKRIILLAAILLLVLAGAGFSCAEAPAQRDLEIRMQLSERELRVGDTIRVDITITNTSDRDLPEAMTLWDPRGIQISDFGDPVLKSGDAVAWSGEWTATEEDLKTGMIIFTVRYTVTDESGESRAKAIRFSRKIVALQPEATPEPGPADYDDVLLYGVYRPNPGTGWVAVGCVDRGGNVWLAEKADVNWPARDEDIREMLRTRRGMKMYQNLIGDTVDGTLMNDAWFFTDIPDMVDAVPQPAEKPRKTGIDVGQEAVYGLRKNGSEEEESVLLGMAGSYIYENPSPEAQRLYLFMWRLMALDEIFNAHGISYATEGVSPRGFRGVTVREFYGLADGDLNTAAVSAAWLDAEGGPAKAELSPEEIEAIRSLADRGMIIRKENDWNMPEDILTCTFTDERGNDLGQIRLFSYTEYTNEEGENIIRTLAAGNDGMYQTALMPRPVDTLTEEELRLLTVRIEGVDYVVGRSTPRDLIRHGWNCFPEWTGAFTFQDPEEENTIEVYTAGGSLDEPIIGISCQYACEIDTEYCGYDGIIDENDPEDPDRVRFTGETDPDEEPPEEDGRQKQWDALTSWIYNVIGADQHATVFNTSVCYTLSDGRYLYLDSNSSPVVLSLSEHGPGEGIW